MGCGRAGGAAQTQSLGRILDYPTKPFSKRGWIIRTHEDAGAGWDRFGDRARFGADHRKTSGDGFSISHAVALETGGKNEHIGRDVELGKMVR